MDALAKALGMDIQTLNLIITAILSFLSALGGVWILKLRNDIAAAKAARATENDERTAKIEELRSDIRLQEKAQEQSAEQFRALFKLISEQIQVGNKMAENIQSAAERQYVQENQRHELIQQYTAAQGTQTNAIETLGLQIGEVGKGVTLVGVDAKASRALTIEVDKSVEVLSDEIRKQSENLIKLRNDVVTALEKVLSQPIAEEVRKAVKEAETNILQHIDKLKTEEVKPIIITEEKANEKTEIVT